MFGHICTTTTTTHYRPELNLAFSQLPVVLSEHVRTFFDSSQSQKSKSEVCAQEICVAMHIKTLLENALYLSSLVSDWSM